MSNGNKNRWENLAGKVGVVCIAANMLIPQTVYASEPTEVPAQKETSQEVSQPEPDSQVSSEGQSSSAQESTEGPSASENNKPAQNEADSSAVSQSEESEPALDSQNDSQVTANTVLETDSENKSDTEPDTAQAQDELIATVSFVDDDEDEKILFALQTGGSAGERIQLGINPSDIIKQFENDSRYKIVSNDWKDGAVFDADSDNTYTIHLRHNFDENYTVTEEFIGNYSYFEKDTDHQLAPWETISHKLTGKGRKDLVTGEVTWTDKPSYTFPAKPVPQIDGYTPASGKPKIRPIP